MRPTDPIRDVPRRWTGRGLAALLWLAWVGSGGMGQSPVAPGGPLAVAPAEEALVQVASPPLDGLSSVAAPPALTPEERLHILTERIDKLEQQLRSRSAAGNDRLTTVLNGMIHMDYYRTGEDSAFRANYGALPDGLAFRRIRIGVQGTYGPWDYRIIPEFAGTGRPSILDVYLGLNDLPGIGHLRVGYFAEPFGLEQSSTIRGVITLERSLLSEVYGRRRRTGIMAFNTWDDEQGTWAVGLFRTNTDIFGDDIGPRELRSSLTGRLTRLLWYREEGDDLDLFHLGVAYSARLPQQRTVQLQTRPEDRFGAATPNLPVLTDTGPIPARFYQLLVGEGLWIRGPLLVQGEYLLVPVSSRTEGALYFQAWYVQISLCLTGEHRIYHRNTATLDTVIPRREFLRREDGRWLIGPGAWELVFRVSQADLNDGTVRGGTVTNFTYGVNWHWNRHMRLMANYIQSHAEPGNGKRSIGHIIGLRTVLEF